MEEETRGDRAEATRKDLIESAHRLFGSRGYANVSLNEVVDASGVTKGALYHHFPGGKKDLMEAVYAQVEADFSQMLTDEILPTLGEGDIDPLDVMEQAIGVTLDASLDPELQQIVLIDAPSVLGWKRWREIADEHSLGLVKGLLSAGSQSGSMRPLPTDTLANLLMAALSQSMLMVGQAENKAAAKEEATETMKALIDGLRP
jgi:AcrR family transcriptional regulator